MSLPVQFLMSFDTLHDGHGGPTGKRTRIHSATGYLTPIVPRGVV